MQKLKGKFDRQKLEKMGHHVKYHGFSGVTPSWFQEIRYTYGSGETWEKVKKILLDHCPKDQLSLEVALGERNSKSISVGEKDVIFKNYHMLLPYFMGTVNVWHSKYNLKKSYTVTVQQ